MAGKTAYAKEGKAFSFQLQTNEGQRKLREHERERMERLRKIEAGNGPANLDNELGHMCLEFLRRKQLPVPMDYNQQLIADNRKAHNELLCRTSSHVETALSADVEHLRGRMAVKRGIAAAHAAKALKTHHTGFKSRIEAATPKVENHHPKLLADKIALYQEARRPTFVPTVLEAKQNAQADRMHADLLDNAACCVQTHPHPSALKIRRERRKHPSWKLTSEQAHHIQREHRRYQENIFATLPRVDCSLPRRALKFMAERHRRPDLDKGSTFHQGFVKAQMEAHNRLVNGARTCIVTLPKVEKGRRVKRARSQRGIAQKTAVMDTQVRSHSEVIAPPLRLVQPWDVENSRPSTSTAPFTRADVPGFAEVSSDTCHIQKLNAMLAARQSLAMQNQGLMTEAVSTNIPVAEESVLSSDHGNASEPSDHENVEDHVTLEAAVPAIPRDKNKMHHLPPGVPEL